ncbi:MAG: DnaD domain protein, partial [Desulfitobacterium sp.]|nr:DnaD domain protein [Desulfitobacterium sp.]
NNEQRYNELLNIQDPKIRESTKLSKLTKSFHSTNSANSTKHIEPFEQTKSSKPSKSEIGKTFRELWEKEIGQPLTPYQEDGLMLFVRLGYTEDIFIEALRYAVMGDHRHMGYVLGILRNWHNQNVRTKEDIARVQQDWEDKRFLRRKLG